MITATLWRGAMIERFAQIEFFVTRSLRACAQAALIPMSDAHAVLPRQQFNALLAALKHEKLAANSAPARRSLTLARDRWDHRNALCHGRLSVKAKSIRIDWTVYDKGKGAAQTLRLTPVEMLERLRELDLLKTALGSQLGNIDKVCRAITA